MFVCFVLYYFFSLFQKFHVMALDFVFCSKAYFKGKNFQIRTHLLSFRGIDVVVVSVCQYFSLTLPVL